MQEVTTFWKNERTVNQPLTAWKCFLTEQWMPIFQARIWLLIHGVESGRPGRAAMTYWTIMCRYKDDIVTYGYVTIDGVWIGEQIIDHLRVVTTNNYNIIADFHTL
jgi:hypothetical protein